MGSVAEKLKQTIQKFIPRRRYTIFSGTNTAREWRMALREWLLGGTYDKEEVIREYERQFAGYCGVQHGISFGAGRMALFAILEAMGLKQGDEIIIPAFTCVVVPNAMLYKGIRPVYVDIDPVDFNIDVSRVEAAITPNTKALYAQHTFGVVCDIKALRILAEKYKLPIIEDGAHAIGAAWENKKSGALGDVAFFSTDHSKVINTHLGGIAVTNDANIAAALKKVQQQAAFLPGKDVKKILRSFVVEYAFTRPWTLWIGRFVFAAFHKMHAFFFFHDEMETTKPHDYPYPCRLSSAQARIGISQLQQLPANLAHRRETVSALEKMIGWYGLADQAIRQGAWLRYSFLVKNRQQFEDRFGKTFELGTWFTSVVQGREEHLEEVGYTIGSCPVAEYTAKHIVNFPTHPTIPVKRLVQAIHNNSNWLLSDIVKP